MKKVVVHPERCVGCMQRTTACATTHSQSKSLLSALQEKPRPTSRVHVGVGLYMEGFQTAAGIATRRRACSPACPAPSSATR